MKTSWQKKWHIWLLMIAAALMLSMAGCGDNDPDGDDDDDAPTIPPAYTLAPDFSSMGGGRAGSAATDPVAPAEALKLPDTQTGGAVIHGSSCSQANYTHAALQVGFWNTALWLTLAVPSWSFVEAFNHDPVLRDDGSWVWSYEVNRVGVTAELHGAFVDGEVRWRMYVSKQDDYEDFLWYRGTSNLPATEGTWTLKNNPTDQEDWIGIEWSRSIANQTWQVTYTNIRTDDDNEGGFINYGIDGENDYDAFYDIYNIVDDNLVQIDSNTTTEAGRVTNEVYFGDDLWRYWDANHCDTVAP